MKHMKITFPVGLIAVAVFALFTWVFFIESVVVEPGKEVVLVDRPYFFGNEGVREQPIREGRVFIFNTTRGVEVNVVPQSIVIAVDDFSSADNILLDFESTIQYRVTDSVRLVDKFGPEWFNNNVRNQYLSIVRKAVKQRTMPDMMTNVTAAEEVDQEITTNLVALVKSNNLPIEITNITLGRARPNNEVLLEMNKTASQQQRSKTIIASEKAEKDRKNEQNARAQADLEYQSQMGLDSEQFVELERARIFADACVKAASCIITGSNQPLALPIK